jgi:hypothetical protein
MIMETKPKFYWYEDYHYQPNVLTLNDCYKFIWEDFDSEEEAVEALKDLGNMLFKSFSGAVNLSLELRKKYVIKFSALEK